MIYLNNSDLFFVLLNGKSKGNDVLGKNIYFKHQEQERPETEIA